MFRQIAFAAGLSMAATAGFAQTAETPAQGGGAVPRPGSLPPSVPPRLTLYSVECRVVCTTCVTATTTCSLSRNSAAGGGEIELDDCEAHALKADI